MANATDNDAEDGGTPARGQVKEVLGAVTGDRRVEAEGRAERRVADRETAESASDDVVETEEQAVRERHHDVPAGGAGDKPAEGPLGT